MSDNFTLADGKIEKVFDKQRLSAWARFLHVAFRHPPSNHTIKELTLMRSHVSLASVGLLLSSVLCTAYATPVTGFVAPGPGVWSATSSSGGSTAVVGLVGAGGNLEANQAAPANGAARLVAESDASRADITLADNFGLVRNILSTLKIDYSFYRETVSGSNVSAAPSLKLTFRNTAVTGTGPDRGFTTLIYESYWQPVGTVNNPISGDWLDASIDFTNGRFWSTNGFGQASGGGGPPLRTLAEWQNVFAPTFADATLVSIAFGLGTNNGGVTGYVDSVNIRHDAGYARSFDFGTAAPVSSPGTIGLIAAGLLALGAVRRRKEPPAA